MTTTDKARPTDTARPRRPGVSVRTRITATVAVLVAVALAGAGLIIYALESARLESAAADQADQEVAEFLQLRENGTDPVTGKPFASTEALLRVFLERNVPSDDELFIGWIGNRARFQSTSKHDVTDDFDLIAEIRDNLAAGRTVRTDSSITTGSRGAGWSPVAASVPATYAIVGRTTASPMSTFQRVRTTATILPHRGAGVRGR